MSLLVLVSSYRCVCWLFGLDWCALSLFVGVVSLLFVAMCCLLFLVLLLRIDVLRGCLSWFVVLRCCCCLLLFVMCLCVVLLLVHLPCSG